MKRRLAILLLTILLAYANAYAVRIPLGRRALARSLKRRPTPAMENILRRDLSRDRLTAPRVLTRDRLVNRYTAVLRARTEVRSGLRAGTHLTSRISPGHPLASKTAQKWFGLPGRPDVREKVLLKRGTSVRFNKALGGKPGVGEITIVRPASKNVLRNVRRIR
jgi:hypothetical protein